MAEAARWCLLFVNDLVMQLAILQSHRAAIVMNHSFNFMCKRLVKADHAVPSISINNLTVNIYFF